MSVQASIGRTKEIYEFNCHDAGGCCTSETEPVPE